MLSRFCISSLRIVRIAQFAHTSNSHSLPALVLSHKSNYATATAAAAASTTTTTTPSITANVSRSNSLKFILADLRTRIENKTALSHSDLNLILSNLRTQKVDSAQALEILQCCAYPRNESNVKNLVNSIWKELQKQDIKFEIQHYKCLLQLYRDKKDVKRAQATFDEMIQAGIKPDAVSYHCLLGAYCKAGNIEKAIEILGMMDKDNLYINESTYNNLVQCHIICGNIDAANETMASLKEAGFKLNFYTLESLLQFFAKAGDLENIQKTFDRFQDEKLELLNRDIFRTMCDLAVNGHADKIDALIPYLKATIEMRRALLSAITNFVENRQSQIVPKLLHLSNGDTNSKVKALIQEMVRLSTPKAEFEQTIEQIEAQGTTIENNFDLFKPALEGSSEEVIRRLLAHMKSRSIEVSESVFEKLFRLAAEKGMEEVLDVVNLMCSEFEIQPQITFIRDVILPGLNGKENPTLAFAKLQATKIRIQNVNLAIINNSLNNGDIKTAYTFSNSTQRFYGIELIKRPLLKAFQTTGDVLNFVPLVRVVHDSFRNINQYYQEKKFTDADIQEQQKQFIEKTLQSAISSRRSDTKLITDLLTAFVEEGLAIRAEHAEKIQSLLQVSNETQIGRLVKKLSSETLELKPIKAQRGTPSVMNQLSSADVQNILEVKVAQGHNAMATEKLLFLAYVREGNTIEIESMLAKSKLSLSNSDYALLIDLYTRTGNLENALNMLKRVCANNASFKLDPIKVAKLVTLMVEKDSSFEEIANILRAHRKGKPEFRIFVFEHLLDRLAANGKAKLVEKLFDTLIEYSYIEPTIESTRPLVMSYIQRSKFVEAVEKYEHLSVSYNLVPMTMILFVHLIRHNEIDLLQRAYDAFEKVAGESTALSRLAFAFIECGQERQARTIFENERTKNISKFINRECKEYVKYKRLETSKTLLAATKGLYCDRHVIYETILDILQTLNKAQEALDLWCEYSTEDRIIQKPSFKRKLADLLRANQMEIPFELETSESTTNTNQPKTSLNQDVLTN